MALQLKTPRSFKTSSLSSDHPFEVLKAYLNGSLSLSQAVEGIAKPVEEAHDFEESAGSPLMALWSSFNGIIEQIPHDHHAHTLMAELLVSLRNHDVPSSSKSNDSGLWKDLPDWEPTLFPPWSSPSMKIIALTAREVDLKHDTLARFGGEETFRDSYTNQNAFMARLAPLEGSPDVDVYALSALRWALEDDLSAHSYYLNMPGATMWLIYAGEYIYQSQRHHIRPEEDVAGLLYSPHPWWDDGKPSGFSPERWRLWKSGLSELVKVEEIDAGTRELVQQALDAMHRVESSY